ncbi:S8 family serine peptidase [Lentilactobacillus parafarraginis]|uniref:Lactocepin n=2 Tax=Lentilactobacillus parafarraginis TaxID=390842 RepID=A0A0R1YPH1_9LACO|nr:S8 family serine peptidase [Lentilactobacillus parafarraginis]KRM43999.1 hypothetical protein FD47_GL001034 [Lentilactobacillus parafarraginis DSM 18390 = JCM 14109]
MKHIFKSFGETKRHPFIIATLLAISTIGLFMTTEMTATQAQSIKQPTTFSQHKPAKKPTKTNQTTSFNQQRQAALTRGNVPTLWSQGYQGQGMVIAVIDSGIQNHPDLRLSNNQTAKISKADAQQLIAQKGYGKYISPKIPFAYDYVNNNNDDTAADSTSGFHGEEVGGVAAANGIEANQAKYMKGVAPQAQLLNLKVFGGFADEIPNDVARAIHDAVDLGADVINLSLGLAQPHQSLTDEEQAAVKYATDHGVFVSVAGSNYGHAGSLETNANDLSDSTTTTYEPANSGTIADPGVANSAMTVGSANTKTGSKSAMSSFSAWGPTPEFAFKPDITAPGDHIATIDENKTYTFDSGTSFASPYIAGSAALVLQKIHKDQPNLKGAALVNAAKVALMNASQPMNNSQFPGEIVSPRLQGAGVVNVANAANLNAAATDAATGSGAVALRQIGQITNFSLNVTNHGAIPQTYRVDTTTGPDTETRKADKNGIGVVHDVKINGASLTASLPTITVDPGKTVKLDFKLDLGSQAARNKIAEGYISLVNSDAKQNLTIPYVGYYGDATTEQIIDQPANQTGSDFGGGYMIDNHNTPLGVSDRTSLASYINAGSPETASNRWDATPGKVDDDKIAISPNGDGKMDVANPYVFAKQSLAKVQAAILNSKGQVIRVIDQETNTDKSIHDLGSDANNDLALSVSMRPNPTALTWNGQAYDQATGKMKVVPDGRYQYRIETTNFNNGADKVQDWTLPVQVDTKAPKIVKATYHCGRLTVGYRDSGVGFTKLSAMAVKVGKKVAGVSLNNSGRQNQGVTHYTLSKTLQKALQHSPKIHLALWDVAGNQATKTLKLAKPAKVYQPSKTGKSAKVMWTLMTTDLPEMLNRQPYAVTTRFSETSGISFKNLKDNNFNYLNANSKAYNPATRTLTISGKVTNPKSKLTILKSPNQNAAENQVHIGKSGQFSYQMPLDPTGQRGIGYILKTPKKGKVTTARGTLEVFTDMTPPTLTLTNPNLGSQATSDQSQLTTAAASFTVQGTVNDNVDGYRLYINGNNVFHEQNDAGFVNHDNPHASANPYGGHAFSETYSLLPGQNHFTVTAVDLVGNTVTKTFTVTRQS